MKTERINFKSCCGGDGVFIKLDAPITINLLNLLKQQNYIESEMFTRSGILYMDNQSLTLTGAFGSNKIQIKCKIKNCTPALDELEKLLNSINV